MKARKFFSKNLLFFEKKGEENWKIFFFSKLEWRDIDAISKKLSLLDIFFQDCCRFIIEWFFSFSPKLIYFSSQIISFQRFFYNIFLSFFFLIKWENPSLKIFILLFFWNWLLYFFRSENHNNCMKLRAFELKSKNLWRKNFGLRTASAWNFVGLKIIFQRLLSILDVTHK